MFAPNKKRFGPSVMDGVDEFTHNVAIKISRVMNSLNPNDLLARRVIDIAKNNSADGFIQAAAGFGLTQVTFLKELHTEILDYLKQEKLGHHVAPIQGITVHDTDVLEPEPARKGGLVRPDTVRTLDRMFTRCTCLKRFSNTLSVLQPNLFRHQPHGDPSSDSTSSLKRKDQQQKPLSLITETEKDNAQTARSLNSRVRSIRHSHLISIYRPIS
jgi:hypothetical protein